MAENKTRLRFLSLVVVVCALVLIGRLYHVQIVSGDTYREKGERQYIAGPNYFDRGNILFLSRDGTTIPAASVRSGFTLVINMRLVTNDLDEIYTSLGEILPLDREEFNKRTARKDSAYSELAKRLTLEEAEAIQALKIPGVSVVRQRWRSYPGGSLSAHTIGFIGFQGDELAGRYGLERSYEKVLKRTGDDAFVNFFAEIFSNIKKSVSPDEDLAGDIVTTLEPSVVSMLESELKTVNEKYSSSFSGGIIIDPKTGAIYAMSLYPSFDPNAPQSEKDVGIFRNRFVEDRYEMGSIIKPIALSAALDTGVITPSTRFNDPGCMTLNTKTFCNYDGKSHGYGISMQTVLSKSLNTGMAFIVSKMGKKSFAEYMFRFGLDEKTGIDLPNEGMSLVSNLKTNRDLEYAQASFGQGIALTPIVTVRALSALANGGTLITPHLVKEIRYKLGHTRTLEYPDENNRPRVISKEASEEISRMLTESVDRTLRNGGVRLEKYSVAAKTGTAQIAKESGGGYYEDRYLHSFFGYFPSYDPEFLIFLYTYHPKGVQYASETLTDTFFNLTKYLINYYNIPPDREEPPAPRG